MIVVDGMLRSDQEPLGSAYEALLHVPCNEVPAQSSQSHTMCFVIGRQLSRLMMVHNLHIAVSSAYAYVTNDCYAACDYNSCKRQLKVWLLQHYVLWGLDQT